MILEQIQSPADVKAMDKSQLPLIQLFQVLRTPEALQNRHGGNPLSPVVRNVQNRGAAPLCSIEF